MTPVEREGYKFYQDLQIPCYQTNRQTSLRPAAFMDLAQELAMWAASGLGFGYDNLHVHHVAWVLSRMHIHFGNLPRWREKIRLYTWHKGSDGPFFLRDFIMQDAQGEPCITCTSSWVVINEESRHFVRPEEFKELLKVGGLDDAIAQPAPKLQLPRDVEAEPVAEHTVSYSDLDLVGHTNNARYVVWAMDCLPLEVAEGALKDLYIVFNKETTFGEKVSLYRLKEGNAWYIEGRVDSKTCFVVKFEY